MTLTLKVIAGMFLLMDAQVTRLDGSTVSGELSVFDEDQVAVEVPENGTVELSIGDVLKVDFPQSKTAEYPASSLVVLGNQSQVTAVRVTATATSVIAESELLGKIEVPRDLVRSIRLRSVSTEWQAQWDAFLERTNERDMLIVEKRDGSGLDFLAGVVSGIDDETVPFLLNESEVPVPRERVYGVIYALESKKKAPQTGANVKFADGSVLTGRDIFVEDSQISFETSWEEFIEADLSQVIQVDFSAGRIHYLSDLDPIEERYYGLEPEGTKWGHQFEADRSTRTGLSRPWRMSRDRFPNTGRPPLTIRGRRFEKGLCIFPSARIEYALNGKYMSLSAVVGVDDDVAFNQRKGLPQTAVEMRIEKDGEQVTQKLIRALDDPIVLDVDLRGADTLTLFVDFGDGSSVCDYLDIANARLIVSQSASQD